MSRNLPRDLRGDYNIRASKRLVVSTGLVTAVAARTATAGFLFTMRWPSAAAKCYIKYVGARFTLTTAFGTAQVVGCDLILARSYTASATGGTAIDVGSTVADTNNLSVDFNTSLFTVDTCRVATTDAFTAGTQTLDANPIGLLTDWAGAIGDQVPRSTSGAAGRFGTLFSARDTGAPIKLAADEGIVCRNQILMGATGVGRWDFCVEWDEGNPNI